MVRSLWTGATGMVAQQTNIDVIANNLANVNTMGYKTQMNEFKSLLYQNIQTETTSASGEIKPTSAQVGLGVRNSSIITIFGQGALMESSSPTAFAISGDAFFAVRTESGEIGYTRNGNFQWSVAAEGGMALTDTDGCPVMDSDGNPIILDDSYLPSQITIDSSGQVCYPDENNNPAPIGIQIGLYQFNNPGGLEKQSGSMYFETEASGAPLNEYTTEGIKRSSVWQGYLEGSGVQIVDEMVNMITAQRAYEMNSKIITTSDEMMQQANNLKR